MNKYGKTKRFTTAAWNTRSDHARIAELEEAERRDKAEICDLQMLLVRFGDPAAMDKTIAWKGVIARAFEGRCLKCGGLHLGMAGDCMGPPRPPHPHPHVPVA